MVLCSDCTRMYPLLAKRAVSAVHAALCTFYAAVLQAGEQNLARLQPEPVFVSRSASLTPAIVSHLKVHERC